MAKDMRRVEILMAAGPPDVEGALYHCRQAVGKAFKAFLVWHDTPFRRVHELDVIGGQCADVDPSLRDLVDRADTLTKYAWQFRYRPNDGGRTGDPQAGRSVHAGILRAAAESARPAERREYVKSSRERSTYAASRRQQKRPNRLLATR
jgi:hypothetical protein